MLKPYETVEVKIQEKSNLLIETGINKIKGVLHEGDTINLELFETENENIAIFKVFENQPTLNLEMYNDKDVLKGLKNKRITKKKLETSEAAFSLKLLNQQPEDFFTDKQVVGGYFTSSGTKLIQIFVPKNMMYASDFKTTCLQLINELKE